MTVTTTLDRQYFDGDGSNKVFPFNFRFFTNDQIYVSLIAPDGTITPQFLTTNYTLSGALQAGGGTVTMIVAPPLTVPATRVFVQRILSQTQPTSIRNQGKFYPEIHEDAFDRLTMLIQQALAGLANALQLTFSKTGWNFLGYKGINVGTPTQPTDAATKGYVDSSSQGNNSYTDGQILRTVRGGVGEVLTQLPPAASRANKVMGFDGAGNPIGLIPASGSGTELAIDLANYSDPNKGLGMVGFVRSMLSASITNAAQMFNSQSVNVREKRFTDLITFRPNPDDYTTWDWQPAIQGAIDYVYAIAFAAQRINAIPSIEVPGAVYRMYSGITTFQWIKIVFIGNATFDFSLAPQGVTGIKVQNKVTWTTGGSNVSVSGALSPCINGSRGVLFLIGPGFSTSTGAAIAIGNDVDGYDPCREVRIHGVFINRWMIAIDFMGYDTYLAGLSECRLEFNRYNIRTPLIIQNSGERMQFFDCTLAGAESTVLLRGPGFDLHFIGGSADFNGDVVKIDGGTYCSLNFTNFHFEGWDGYIVNAVTNPSWVFVNITNTTILPTRYLLTQTGYNSAGRPLFKSPSTGLPGNGLQINITSPRIGIVDVNYAEDPFLVSGLAGVNVVGNTMYERNFAGTENTQGMKDWNLQADAVGTLASALSGWTIDNLNLINSANSKMVLDGSKKVLQMTSSDPSSGSYFRMTAKDRTPIAPGQIAWAWCSISMTGTTGTANLQPNVAFYDALGNLLPFPALYASNAMRTVFNNATLPNFSDGDARYISTEPMPYRAPPGAAFVAFRSMFTVFGGTMNVSRASVWVAK